MTDLSSKEAARAGERVLVDVATDAGNAVNDEKPPVKIVVGNERRCCSNWGKKIEQLDVEDVVELVFTTGDS